MARRATGEDPRELLKLGVHPASRAWLLRERNDVDSDLTCGECAFYKRRAVTATCVEPNNFGGPAPTLGWWPACVLIQPIASE